MDNSCHSGERESSAGVEGNAFVPWTDMDVCKKGLEDHVCTDDTRTFVDCDHSNFVQFGFNTCFWESGRSVNGWSTAVFVLHGGKHFVDRFFCVHIKTFRDVFVSC